MIDFGKKLYAFSDKKLESVNLKVGQMGPMGVGVSEHRKGVMTGPKISAIALVIDLLFKYSGSIALYASRSTEKVYMELKGVCSICDGETINFFVKKGATYHVSYSVLPYFFWSVLFSKNTELTGIFKEIVAGKDAPAPQMIYKMCDSFYYGNCLDVLLNEREILEAEVQASIRSEMYELENFGTKYFGTSDAITPQPRKKASATKKTDFLQECKDGKYRVAYEWSECLKGHIIAPSFLDKYEATPEFEEIVKKIKFRADRILERMDMGLTGAEAIGEDCMNIMLVGKPGTGKTTLVYAIGAATGMPVCSTVHTKHTDEDEYEGKTKIVDGKPQFVETDSLLFHQFGGIDVNEEINLTDPSVTMGGLGQKLVYPYIVKKNGYETITRHPLNVVFGTMNVGTNGSNSLNQALANRFKTPYILDDPTRETFIEILIKASKKSKEVCEWVYNAYEKTLSYLRSPSVNEEEICQNLSIRTCLGALDNLEEGQSPTRALINSIVGAIAIVDLEVARRVQREQIEILPNFVGEI